MFKKKNQFLEVQKAIEESLKNRRLDYAIALYNKLKEEYDKLDENKKVEYQQKFIAARDKLLIILKVEEMQEIARTDDIELLKEKLKEIEMYTNIYQSTLPERFLSYIKHNYSYAYKIYYYKLHKLDLNTKIADIYKLVNEEHYDKALKQFPSVMEIFNQMSRYYRNEKLLFDIIELKKHIKLSLIKQKAFSEHAEVNEKTIRKLLKQGKLWESFGINRKAPLEEPPKPKREMNLKKDESSKEIKNLKQLIKKGETKLSQKEFNRIFR